MTDINKWETLITRKAVLSDRTFGDDSRDYREKYYVLPFNDYQLGNLLGALTRVEATGDWWAEVASVIVATMNKYKLNLHSNWGDSFRRCDPSNLKEATSATTELQHLKLELKQSREDLDDFASYFDGAIDNAKRDPKGLSRSLKRARSSLQHIQNRLGGLQGRSRCRDASADHRYHQELFS